MEKPKLENSNPVGGSGAGEGAFPPTPNELARMVKEDVQLMAQTEVCPHGRITVSRELVWDESKKLLFVRSDVRVEVREIASECARYGIDFMDCIEVYDCGCLLYNVHDSLGKGVFIIPATRALEFLKDEVERKRRSEYLYKRYQKLLPQVRG